MNVHSTKTNPNIYKSIPQWNDLPLCFIRTSKGRVSEAIKCAVSTVKGVDSGRFSCSCSPPTPSQVFEPSDSTLWQRAHHLCRPTLDEYKDLDFFVHEVKLLEELSHLVVVPTTKIEGKQTKKITKTLLLQQ